ncbi:hypothetical protein BcanWSM471_10700 [Bradyrhizobium sp. WSM471]|nr:MULTISPECIES: hypothetical protein [Bradyrhizobium]UFW43506.1 hypothetical protein BcanWSM471_10700 [Bradyrhizobium canariense]
MILTATFLHGFWPDSVNSVVPGDWSIAAEMTFYLVFPLLITAFGSRRHLYVALAIVLHLVNVCLFKPWAFALFSAYYGPGICLDHAAHQLPESVAGLPGRMRAVLLAARRICQVGRCDLCGLHRAVLCRQSRHRLARIQLSDDQPRARRAGCRLHQACDPLPAARSARPQFLIRCTCHFAVIYGLRQLWPVAEGLVSLFIAYVVTAALSYLVARATWHLVERRAQDLAHRLTSAGSDRSTLQPAITATAAGMR